MNRKVVQESAILTTISLTETFTTASLPTFLGTCMSQRAPIRYVAPMSQFQFQSDRGTRFIPIFYLLGAYIRSWWFRLLVLQRLYSDYMTAHLLHKASLPNFHHRTK